jgi:hypothetical protein
VRSIVCQCKFEARHDRAAVEDVVSRKHGDLRRRLIDVNLALRRMHDPDELYAGAEIFGDFLLHFFHAIRRADNLGRAMGTTSQELSVTGIRRSLAQG